MVELKGTDCLPCVPQIARPPERLNLGRSPLYICVHIYPPAVLPLSIAVPFSIFREEIASLKLLFHNLLPTLMSVVGEYRYILD